MKRLQHLFATLMLICALSFSAAADGIIQTGSSTPPPPPPTQSTPQSGDEMNSGETRQGETTEGETSALEEAAAVALDFLRHVFTLF